MRQRTCSVEDCERPELAKTYCSAHYKRWRKYGDPNVRHRAAPVPRLDGANCLIDGCLQEAEKQGVCLVHYVRKRRGQPMDSPIRKLAPKGSGYTHHSGYRIRTVDGRRVPEHQIVMERMIDRTLESFEQVHHLNGIRHDNRPENLELWTKPQPCGQRPEDLVAWVVEHYPGLVREALEREGVPDGRGQEDGAR